MFNIIFKGVCLKEILFLKSDEKFLALQVAFIFCLVQILSQPYKRTMSPLYPCLLFMYKNIYYMYKHTNRTKYFIHILFNKEGPRVV